MCHHGHCQKIGLTHADLLYYKTKNILFLLCTPMFLLYNSELGVIISSEFFSCKRNSGRSIMYSLVSLFNFLTRCGGRLPHEVLGQFLFYIHLYCNSKITSPTLVQNPCILHALHLKDHQSQNKVLQVLWTRGSSFFAHGVFVTSFTTS